MKNITTSYNAKRATNRKGLFALSIAGCLTALLASPAQAAVITVPNFSFEENAGADGNFVTSANDWTIAGTFGGAGSYNPVDAIFSGTTGGNIPSPGEGTDIHLSNLSRSGVAGSGFSTFTSAASLATITDGLQYTLTVAGGNRAGATAPDQYTIELLVDGLSAASTVFDGNTITADSFQDITTSFIATPVQAGGALTVRLTHSTFAGTGGASGHFDNVRLTAITPIPEPSTLALIMTSGGLLLIQRRRFKISTSIN